MFNMQKMMKQAQEMQFKLQEVQEKLKDIEVEADAGGGMVKITMSCAGNTTKVSIDDSLMGSDKETLEDLLVAAMNNANDVKDERIKKETQAMMEGLGLPADAAGGLPF
tara:strand:+ start:1154 stop:1480 length:327 start_codon:yes stop_codon:yes gene_type:complete